MAMFHIYVCLPEGKAFLYMLKPTMFENTAGYMLRTYQIWPDATSAWLSFQTCEILSQTNEITTEP